MLDLTSPPARKAHVANDEGAAGAGQLYGALFWRMAAGLRAEDVNLGE